MRTNQLSLKTVRKVRKVFASFMIPVFLLQMVSANLLFAYVPLAKAEVEVSANEASVEQEKADAEVEKVVEKVDATEKEEIVEEKTEVQEQSTQIDILKPVEKELVDNSDTTLELQEEKTVNEVPSVPTEPSIDPVAASIEKPLDQESATSEPVISKNVETWAVDGKKAITNDVVELGKTYVAPQNDQVTVTFTKLPENPGTLSIEEVKLTDEQVKSLGALSNKAYDVTSSMENGTFEYDLTLPKPKDQKNVEIKFAEDISEIENAQTVAKEDIKTGSSSVSVSLDHFTIFFPAVGAPPLINALSLAGRAGDTTDGKLFTLDLNGVTDADLAGPANITVSEACTLNIIEPLQLPTGKQLVSGSNNLSIADLFAFTPPASLLRIVAGQGGGSIGVTGTLTDSNNVVTNIVIIITEDVVKPVITRTGADIVTVGLHTSYVDEGATAVDNRDGDITSNIVTVNPVDIDTAGTYFVTYNVLDSNFNSATQVTRTVNVLDLSVPAINSLSFANRTGTVSGGNTVALNLSGTSDIDLATPGIINVTLLSTLTIFSPIPAGPVTLNPGNNTLIAENIFGFPINSAALLAAASAFPGGIIPVAGTLSNANGTTNITINITVDSAFPTISAMTFAGKTGTVTGGNTVALNLSGVSDANLASAGSITVSETSTLQITSPLATGPINLNAGNNVLSTTNIFGFSILASELITTASAFPGGIIAVQGTLTDASGNITNVAINITVDIVTPTISAMTFAGKTGTVTGGNTVALNLSGVSDANLASAGSITVSETSTLQITSPLATGPINLNAGNNVLSTVNIFGFNITAAELKQTATLPIFNGLISVIGTLTDVNGNTTSITINIVVDVTAPVITLIGASPVSVEYGSTYIDAGATAFDTADGNITASIVTVNPVNTNVLGQYTVTYNVTDSNGNAAAQVTRIVNVVAKAITVTADAKTKVYGAVDPALTYQITSGALVGADAFSGALTRNPGENVGTYAIIQGTLTAGGNYVLTFVSANLTITASPLTVTADAKTKTYGDADPVLTYQITSGSLVGTDAFSGALARVAGENVGTYAITQGTLTAGANYNLTFVGGNLTITKKALAITADDKTKEFGAADPVFTFTTSGFVGTDGITVIDTIPTCNVPAVHSNIGSFAIICAGGIDNNYDFNYVNGTLTVQDTTAPTITLLGGNPVNIQVGTPYVDAGAAASDNFDGNLTASIVTVNPVDINTLGSYTVSYDVADTHSNIATQVTRTVNVVLDLTAPVVTLNGGNVTMKERKTYVEQGATWSDNVDGSGVVTSITSNLNTRRPGTYTITYSYTDAAGNVGTAARTVKVTNVSKDDDDDDDDDDNDNDQKQDLMSVITASGSNLFSAPAVQGSEDEQLQDQNADSNVEGAETEKDEPTIVDVNKDSNPFIPWAISLLGIGVLAWLGFKSFFGKSIN